MSDAPDTSTPTVEDPFKGLNSHEELLTEIKEATSEVLNAADEVSKTRDAIEDHNLDSSAHPDLRQYVQEAVDQAAGTDTIDNRISDHNISPTSHSDIRALIEQVKSDTTTATGVVSESLAEHNTDETAHSDIRESINNLKTQVGSINLNEVTTQVSEIQSRLDGDITADIEALQSVDARHDNEIATNRDNISKLDTRLTNLGTDIVTIANTTTTSISDIDAVKLKAHCLDREAVLGYSAYSAQGPNLNTMSTTLPTYVSHNRTTTFIITEVKDSTAGEQVSMSIEQGVGDYTITPLQNITPGTAINMNVGGGGQAGDILDFTVTFKDNTTQQTVKRVMAVMLARPLSQGALSITGLPSNAEPGAEFKVQISNLTDDGSGRYHYSIDVGTSGIEFSKTSEITENDKITAKIPEGAKRQTELTFTLIVHDIYGADQEYNFSIYINALPSTDDFTHTVPGTIVPGKQYTIKFDGILSANGKKANYNIVEDEDNLITFSKYKNILANENVQMNISRDVVRGQNYSFKVNTSDENNVSVEVTVEFVVNLLPLSNDITTTLPGSTKGGVSLAFKITGGSDTEQPREVESAGSGRTVVSYDIDAGSSSFNFSKITAIKPNEEVTVTLPKVQADDERFFNIYAVDDLGERSASPKIVNITITPIYLPVTPTITAPANGSQLQYDDGVDMTWSAFSYTTDMRSANEVVYTY